MLALCSLSTTLFLTSESLFKDGYYGFLIDCKGGNSPLRLANMASCPDKKLCN